MFTTFLTGFWTAFTRYRWVLAALVFAVGAWGGWALNGWRWGARYVEMQVAWAEERAALAQAATAASETARAREAELQTKVNGVRHELDEKNRQIAVATDTATDAQRMRDEERRQFTTALNRLSADSFQAIQRYAAAATDVVGACDARLRAVAEDATRCDAERWALDRAWPDGGGK